MTLDHIAMASPFSPHFKPTTPPTIPQSTSKFQHLLDIIDQLCHADIYDVDPYYHPGTIRGNARCVNIDDRLTVSEIQQFLAATITFENRPYYALVTGHVVTKLIQNAHNAGETHFELNLNGLKPLDYFGSRLTRLKNKKLNVIIHGELGSVAFDAAHCNAIVEMAGEKFAHGAIGNYSVMNYKQSWDCLEYTIFQTDPYTLSHYNHTEYYQFGSSIKDRFIVTRTSYPVNKKEKNTTEYHFCHKQTKDIIIKNDNDACNILSLGKFNDLWQPAVEPFKRMKQLFGGKS